MVKKEESVLSVLMYLFHHHMEKDSQIVNLNDTQLIDELKSAGFQAHNIGKAFRWLHRLVEMTEEKTPPSDNSFRVFSEEEIWLINTECRNYILSLEKQGILTPHAREIVIHQTLELINEGVDIHLLKWVTLMVLFNMPGSETALSHMEFLVLSNALDTVH